MEEQPKNKGGRPKKEVTLERRPAFLPPGDWKKVEDHGGQPWLREVVRKTKVPGLPGSKAAKKL